MTPASNVSQIAQHFRENHPTTVVIGGPANSGKTTVAACVGDQLVLHNWQVVGFTSHSHELNEPEELVRLISGAVSSRLRPGLKTVIVLDGLRTVGRSDLGDALSRLSDKLNTSILVTARFAVEAEHEWRTGLATTVPLFVNPTAMQSFAKYIISRQPALSEIRQVVGALVKAAGPDMWMLTQMLSWARDRESAPGTAGKQMRAAFIHDRLDTLSEGQREQTRKLAAASLLDTELSEAEIGLDPDALETLGASRSSADGWSLRSCVLCRMLLSDNMGNWSSAEVEQRVLALTRPRLHALLKAGDGPKIVQLLNGSARYSDHLLLRLVKSAQQEVVEWAMVADAVLIARLLRVADSDLGPQVCEQLVVRLCYVLPTAYASAPELSECMKMINRYRHFVDDGALTGVVAWLRDGGLKLALELNASPTARLGALRQLERFHDPELSRLIVPNLPRAVQGLSSDQPDDYLLARRAEDLRQRVIAELNADQVRLPALPPDLADVQAISDMLDRTPQRTDSIALFVNALILRLSYRRENSDWDALLDQYDLIIRNALDKSPLGEQIRALHNLAVYHRALCVRLLNRPALARGLARQIKSSQPMEVAVLLRTVIKLHGKFAKELLYDKNDEPKAELVEQLAQKVVDLGESKSAGMLLRATAAVDELYGSRGRGFAKALAEALTASFSETVLQTEQRPSVISHFLLGLWEAGADYLDRVMIQVEDNTVRWVINSNRAWAPRLALLLGADDERGERFLETLANRIDDATILDRMLTTVNSGALATHHQLGRALFPELPIQFAKRFDEMSLDVSLMTARTEQLLRCCVEIRDTLIAAGAPAGPQVLTQVRWNGERELKRVRHPGDLAESLRLLTKLDPAESAQLVDLMTLEQSTYNVDQKFLEHQVRRALPTPSAATELLSAIESAQPGAGADLLQKVRSRSGQWHAFGSEIAHAQDPREQSKILLQLTALGLRRGQTGTAWMDTLAQKWLRTLPSLRSPQAIADLVRMFATWDSPTGADMANAVNMAKLTERLTEGAVTDLQAAWRIMAAFIITSRHDRANLVLQAMQRLQPGDVVRACGLSDGARLVHVAQHIDSPAARQYAAVLAEMVDKAIARRHVVDRNEHWLNIGWAVYAVTSVLGTTPLGETRPPVLPDVLSTGIGTWGVTWLSDVEWTEDVHANAMRIVTQSGPPASPFAAAVVLAALARRGGLDMTEPANWTHVSNAPFGILQVLFAQRSDDLKVKPVLKLIEEKVHRRLEQHDARGDLDAHLLRKAQKMR